MRVAITRVFLSTFPANVVSRRLSKSLSNSCYSLYAVALGHFNLTFLGSCCSCGSSCGGTSGSSCFRVSPVDLHCCCLLPMILILRGSGHCGLYSGLAPPPFHQVALCVVLYSLSEDSPSSRHVSSLLSDILSISFLKILWTKNNLARSSSYQY